MRQFSKEFNTYIQWVTTGEIYDQVSEYDWEEGLEGEGDDGRYYVAGGVISCDEIIEVNEIELAD